MDYEEAKQLAQSSDATTRRSLASQASMAPELLYFLARDDDAAVRLAVSGNPLAPREADLLLARDADDAIRARVGEKLGETRPAGTPALSAKKQAITTEIAETLAGDSATPVREAIAVALRRSLDAPAHVVQQLARDIELRVAGPVLQNSPLLGDGDLADIMNSGPIKGVLNAIAKRRNLSQGVSEILVNRAVNANGDASAVGDLLANGTARIGAGTMNKIIDHAPDYGAWHRPLAARPDLSSDHMRRVASIPSDAIAETMSARNDLDDAALTALSHMVAKRMAELTQKRAAESSPTKPAADLFLNSVMKGGKVGPVCAAISLRAGIAPAVTMRMLTSNNAKAIASLAWKAGMSAVQARFLQTSVGGISEQRALGPTSSGGYPLAAPDMEWQIGLYVGS
jgi:Uncharacterised protein conserved in bacteria (DUF2336)